MSQSEKSAYYQELKAAGVSLDMHYREYSTEQLKAAVDKLREDPDYVPPKPPEDAFEPVPVASAPEDPDAATHAYRPSGTEEPVRRDPDTGFIWYREEVRKPAYPKPRKRRKLTYVDSGVRKATAASDRYIETFEVAGTETRQAEVKITMPSFQVGVYLDPRYPFKIHVYNDQRGFDLFDVNQFYGGADMVPRGVKRVYIANDLCYDMRTVIQAISQEYRERVLKERLA